MHSKEAQGEKRSVIQLADWLLLFSWKKLLLIPAAWIACVLLHNLVYALLRSWFAEGWDEPFFFILAIIVIPAYTIACAVFSVVRLVIWLVSGGQGVNRRGTDTP